MITEKQLLAVMPLAGPKAAEALPYLNAAMQEFGITTPARVAAFLAQIGHESGQLRCVSENLNYSAEGLANTWRDRYAQKDAQGRFVLVTGTTRYAPNVLAQGLHRKPEAIANNVYANRMGNGPEESGDGWRHRGAGYLQTTGKTNQAAVAAHFGIPLETIGDWLRTPEGAARSAGLFWQTNSLNAVADAGDQASICRAVNGGTNGLADRVALFNIAREVLA